MSTNKLRNDKILYPELSYIITGILFSVHNELGQYAREKQYGDLIEQKIKELKLSYKREMSIGGSGNILDFVIENKVLLELKATRVIINEHYRQVQNYLQQTGLELGILINFRYKYIKPIRILRVS